MPPFPRRTRSASRLATQNNRKAYCEDAQTNIRRQRAAIEKLQAENASIKAEVDACNAEDAGAPNMTVQQDIVKLRESALLFTRKIEAEKKRVEELDAQIRDCDAKAAEKRRTMGGACRRARRRGQGGSPPSQA